jgi:exonuclease III
MSELNIMQWNAQGLARKIIELNELLRNDNIDVICISETHFTENSSPNFTDNLGHLGGLLTMIKKDIDFTELNLGPTSVL